MRKSPLLGLALGGVVLFGLHLAALADGTPATTSPSTNGNSNSGGSAYSYYDCKDAADSAKQACTNANSTAGMNNSGIQQLQSLEGQLQSTNQLTAQSEAEMAQQCKLQADANAALSALSGLKGNACSSAISDCSDDCQGFVSSSERKYNGLNMPDNIQEQVSRAKKLKGQCSALQSNSSAALTEAAALLNGLMQNLECDTLAAVPTPTPSSCDDTNYAATNIVCICQNDPKNAMCVGSQQYTSTASATEATQGAGSPNLSDTDDVDDKDGAQEGSPGTSKGQTGSADAPGGAAGGLAPGAAGAKPAAAGDEGGAARSNVDKSVITGTMGGSGGASGGGGPGGGTSGGGGGDRGGGGKGAGAFDLSKFLPKAGGRGIASMSISAKDGITGATGPSIWEKITNQYQLQKPNMIQDR